MLEDAIFRKTGTTRPPAPLFLTSATNAFDHEDDLIATEALLADVQPVLEGTALTLKAGGIVFEAILKNSPDYGRNPEWQPGSKVRVTGICSVIHDDVRPLMGIWQPQAFQIFMRSPADLIIINLPPWWTPRHIILCLGAVVGGLLLVTGMVTLVARRRLNEQSRHRAMAEAEFAAILIERNRLAREIHDTLAQGLAATSVQLRLAKKQAAVSPESFHQHLDTAQQLVRDSLNEARNSIWNMRSQVLETGDLPSALKNILKQMTDSTELKTTFETSGRVRRLATVIENNCLRVGQEAITNAAKHAQASEIKVRLEYDEKFLRLLVADDGRGFDPAQPPPSEGGFGLVGIRERAAELKATLDIRRAPGRGTEISLFIPLSGE
jgi:signal transduction histidine kinase